MRKSFEIRQALDAKMQSYETLTDANERQALASEINALTAELNEANAMEAAQRAIASQRTLSEPEKKEVKRFSISKFLREAASGKLEGFEAEMAQEGVREMEKSGLNSERGITLPSIITRTYYWQDAAEATYGPEFVDVTRVSYAEALKNNLVCAKAGVQFLDGLQGNVKIVKGGGATASWIAEESAASINRMTYSTATLSPKRLQVLAGYTMDLLKQSSLSVDAMIMKEIVNEHAAALDGAILNGSGASGEPTGIFSAAGINTVALGVNGGAISYDALVDLEKEVALDNGLRGSLAYITNPKVFAAMKKTAKVAGYPDYLVADGVANGYPVYVTNAMPSALTKGDSSGVCSGMLFGNFNEAICGSWGALDFIVDPYSQKGKAVIEISAYAYHDVCCRRADSFAKIADITF